MCKRTLFAGFALMLTFHPLAMARPADATVAQTQPVDVPLIAREVLFGNPDRAALRISPDGKQISFLAPVDGVMNLFVAPVNDIQSARVVTAESKRGIRTYFWAFTNEHLIYLQDDGGNENWNVHVVGIIEKSDRNLTHNEKVAARIVAVSEKFPDEIIVGVNAENPQFHDLVRQNIRTGATAQFYKNPGQLADGVVGGLVVDDDYKVRFAAVSLPDGGQKWMIYDPSEPTEWRDFQSVPMEDALTTGLQGLDKEGKVAYFTDSRERNIGALTSVNLETGESTVLAEDPKADAGAVLTHPTNKNVQAVAFTYARQEWKVLDPAVQPDIDYLKTVADGDFSITSRTQDDTKWTVAYILDDGPVKYFLYDRPAKKATFLCSNRKAMEGLPLLKMRPVVIKSRDGVDLVSYLTLPNFRSNPATSVLNTGPFPMVLDVHGGPWARDGWGLNPYHQWLANRGYAVLSVNFRGSTGFGKAFLNAGNHEWGGKMHDDLLDAVDYAVKNGIADKDNIAIMGGSYGGYATLVGMTFTPDVFACGVDIVGPSSLVTLLNTIPPYWAPAIAQFKTRVGDHLTEEGRKFLDSRSPLNFVDKITKPLLIGQGANDPRVKQSEADQIVKAMQEKKIPVTYVLYPDEGHGFARPPNNMSFNAITEAFLAKHLGGRAQPIGDDFKGSSLKIPAGVEAVEGVAEALGKGKE